MTYNNRTRYNRKSFRPSSQRRSFGGRSSNYVPHYQRQYPQTDSYHNGGERRRYYDARPSQPSYDSYRHNNSSRYGKKYSKYHYPQPSGEVFIEEPETESEDGDSESEYDGLAHSDDERTYDFDLQSNDGEDYESDIYYDSDGLPEGDYEEVFVIPQDFDGIDVNDDLENEAIDALEAEGAVRDVNDDLLRFYDSDSDLDISSSEEYDSEIDEGILLLDSSDSESDSESSSSDSDSDSDSDSYTDLELDSEEEVEVLRQALAQVAESADELSDSESDSEDENIFIEVDSDFYNSEDDDDIVVDEDIESSDSSDDEGLTIYKHRFDLPDRYDSDNDSTDPELELSDDEDYEDEFLLRANDSDDEYEVIDMSKDLEGSKDCELVELDDSTYQLNLRLPSLVKEDLKINFLKNENELVINGKFNFTLDDSDDESDEEKTEEIEAEAEAEADSSDSDFDAAKSDADSDSDSSSSEAEQEDVKQVAEEIEALDSDYDVNAPSSESDSSDSSESESESEAEFSDNEEEVMEDAEQMIKDFQNHEIQFEKRFVFDKVVKFDEIKASFLENGELQLIIPNEGVEVDSAKNNVAISIAGQPQQKAIEAENAEVQAVAEAVAKAAAADVEMAT